MSPAAVRSRLVHERTDTGSFGSTWSAAANNAMLSNTTNSAPAWATCSSASNSTPGSSLASTTSVSARSAPAASRRPRISDVESSPGPRIHAHRLRSGSPWGSGEPVESPATTATATMPLPAPGSPESSVSEPRSIRPRQSHSTGRSSTSAAADTVNRGAWSAASTSTSGRRELPCLRLEVDTAQDDPEVVRVDAGADGHLAPDLDAIGERIPSVAPRVGAFARRPRRGPWARRASRRRPAPGAPA